MSTDSNLICGIIDSVKFVKKTPDGYKAIIDDGNSYVEIPLNGKLPPHQNFAFWRAVRDICIEYQAELIQYSQDNEEQS